MFKRIVTALPMLALVAGAQAVELTEEQRAAILERIAPVGEVCLQGESCGGLPKASAPTRAPAMASSGSRATTPPAAAASTVAQADSAPSAEAMSGEMDDAMSDAMSDATDQAAVSNAAIAMAGTAVIDGEAVYNQACMACHASGAGGAPRVGDVDAWSPRIAKGIDSLHASGINGIAGTLMMAKGGRMDLSDQEVMAAVDFMVGNSQ